MISFETNNKQIKIEYLEEKRYININLEDKKSELITN